MMRLAYQSGVRARLKKFDNAQIFLKTKRS
ncbi:hypothetical protein SAMN06265374_0236 [Roseibium denhamense]|uniref:Transposase n=1 Tax=Roseibium denhamense TaxID=76305 RepID=A0ABY1N5M8_9HYPH|nr:hypothetical protein SAMN06265374_0236 [Roseibium denhamense]